MKELSLIQKQMRAYQSLVDTIEKIEFTQLDRNTTSLENKDFDQIKKELEMINLILKDYQVN